MHSLIRNEDGFGISRASYPEAEPGEFCIPQPNGKRRARVNYLRWKRFVEGKKVDVGDLDKTLIDSWTRCREMGVDYTPRSCWDFAPMSQLESFNSTLQRISGDVEATAYEMIRGKGLLFTIATADARLVRTCGDLDVLRQADRLNFGPGANWSESSVGTNAIGTALKLGQPIQIFAEEHFCQSHHGWCCSAAPILDPRGNIWGCFDISGPTTSDHSKNIELVLQAARALEQKLSRQYCSELEGQMSSLFSSMFNSVTTGILILNSEGRVTSANTIAELLLSPGRKSLRGRLADEFFDMASFIAKNKQEALVEAVVIECTVKSNLYARAIPTFNANGVWLDTIIAVSETQPTRVAIASPRKEKNFSKEAAAPHGFDHILHSSPVMRQAIRQAANAARTMSTVLLTGESGTGKELFAKGIHKAGPRADKPFIAVNCGAFSEELVQSELFGYCDGAFTGAAKRGRIGKFQNADQGVLFLDEIGEMPMSQQVNLLRALEERAIVPVGGTTPRPVDVKIIAATNKDLQELVKQGRFREDLFYRLNVVGIPIPALRKRDDDILLLADFHLRRLCTDFGISFAGIAPAAEAVLMMHDWPGNVRELVNCLEFAANNLMGEPLDVENLPPYLQEKAVAVNDSNSKRKVSGFQLKKREEEAIRQALEFHQGNISKTAKALGIGRNTLYSKMERFRIQF